MGIFTRVEDIRSRATSGFDKLGEDRRKAQMIRLGQQKRIEQKKLEVREQRQEIEKIRSKAQPKAKPSVLGMFAPAPAPKRVVRRKKRTVKAKTGRIARPKVRGGRKGVRKAMSTIHPSPGSSFGSGFDNLL